MSYEELKNNGQETEILSEDHRKLCRMCGDLKRVGAPKNFDFHLKARIAKANPNDFQTNTLLPFLRYALPLCVVLLLAGFVVFSGILTNEKNAPLAENAPAPQTTNAPTVAEKTVATIVPPAAESNTITPSANAETPKIVSNVQLASLTNKISIANSANKNAVSKSEDFIGTRVSASRASRIITPPGIPLTQDSAGEQSVNAGNQNSISVKSVLLNIGIEAEFINPNWKVKSVQANSIAERSGMKNGDLIEAADDRKFDSETISEQSLTIKTLHVLREGKKIAVELK